MSRFPLYLLSVAGCLLAFEAFAFDAAGTPRDGVLVLRNGGILSGQIVRVGDRYLVVLGDRGEARVPVRDVEMHCLDMDEVYQRKRSRLAAGDVKGHVDLAEWCLQQKLLSRAADELLTVIALQPRHPQLEGLQRRLQLAVEQPATSSATAKPATLSVALVDLEKTSRDLPDGVLEDFTSQVQPLLLNRCGANSCHGNASSSEFRLVRPMWTRTISRRFTQRNLYAVMQQVHSDDPPSSPLLQVPSAPHGGMDTGVFGPREQEQLDLLADWIRQASAVPTSPKPETIELPPSGLLQASFSQPVGLPRVPADETPAVPTDSAQLPTESLELRPSVSGRYVPRDPFDAEIFNRRRQATVER